MLYKLACILPLLLSYSLINMSNASSTTNLVIGNASSSLQRSCFSGLQSNYTNIIEENSSFLIYRSIKTMLPSFTEKIALSTPCQHTGILQGAFQSGNYSLVAESKYFIEKLPYCCVWFTWNFQHKFTIKGLKVSNTSSDVISRNSIFRESISDVFNLLDWKMMCILVAKGKELVTNNLLTELSDRGVTFRVYSMESGDSLTWTMDQCYTIMVETGINFIVIADQIHVERLLHRINSLSHRHDKLAQLGLMSRWLILGENICIKCLEKKVQNVSNVSILRRTYQSDLNTDWEEKSCEQDLCYIKPERGVPLYEIQTAFWYKNGRGFGTVLSWYSTGHYRQIDDVFPNVRMGLNNVTLIVTTKDWAPFTIKTIVNGKTHYEGICLDLIEEISRRLNFSYVVVEPADNQWGMKMLSGNWTGMIAQLANREVDVMVAASSIQQEREEVMDFIHPFYNDYTSLLLKKPDKRSQKWKLLITPLQWTVILGIIISLPVVTFLLTTIEKYHPCYAHVDLSKRSGLHRFGDCLWYNLAALLNEGGQESPDDQAGRTVVAAWWLFTIVIVASYTSTLTAALTVEKNELPFDTIEEMVAQSQYKWGGTNGSYMFMLFQKSDNAIYQRLWEGVKNFLKDEPDLLNTSHHAQMQRVRNGDYVLMNDKSVNAIEAARDCDLAITSQEFLPLNFGIGLQQDSPYRALFQKHMMAIEEIGILDLWKTKWWPPMNNCTSTGPTEVKPITVIDVQGGYFVLAIGLTLAVFTLLVELYCSRKFRNRKCPLC